MYFEEALYVLDIGQNDLTAGYFLNYIHQQIRDSIPQVLYEFQSHVLALHGQGAKRFMIITTGQLGCLPYILTSIPYTGADLDRYGCAKPYNSMARFFNKELRMTIAKLQQQMLNTTVVVVDGYKLKYNLFVDAARNGFEFTTRACCGYGGGNYNFDLGLGYCSSNPKREDMLHKNMTYNLCRDPWTYIIWDGSHYTEASNHRVARGLFSGHYSVSMFPSDHFCDLFT